MLEAARKEPNFAIPRWPFQQAKAKFNALVEAAEHGPQSVTRRGRIVAVVLSVADYERMSGRSVLSLVEFLSAAGLGELDVPERDRTDFVRDIEL